jgi:hypothetical protein
MKKIIVLLALISTLSYGYEFTGYAPRATQRTTENVLYREFPVYEDTTRPDATLLQTQPMLDVKINTETENFSDRSTNGQDILLELRRSDPRYITPANVNLPLLPSSSSLRNNNLAR